MSDPALALGARASSPPSRNPAGKIPTLPERRHGPARLRLADRSLPYRLRAIPILRPRHGSAGFQPAKQEPCGQDTHAPGEASRPCTSTLCRPFPSLPAPRHPNLAASPWERGLPARQAEPCGQDAHAPGEASRSCTSTLCRPFPSLPAPRRPNFAASPWERGLPARPSRNPAGKMPALPERRHGPARLRFAGRSLPYRLRAAPILRPRPGSAGFQPAKQEPCGQDARAPGEASRSCTSTPCRPFPSLPAPRRPNLAASPWERGLPARQAGTLRARCPRSRKGVTVLHVYALPAVPFPLPAPRRPNLAASPWERGLPARQTGTLRARCPRSRRGVTVLHVYALPTVPFPTGSTPVLHGKGPQFASRANRRMMPTREEKRPWSWKTRRRQHAGNGDGMKTLPPARRSQPRRPRSGA